MSSQANVSMRRLLHLPSFLDSLLIQIPSPGHSAALIILEKCLLNSFGHPHCGMSLLSSVVNLNIAHSKKACRTENGSQVVQSRFQPEIAIDSNRNDAQTEMTNVIAQAFTEGAIFTKDWASVKLARSVIVIVQIKTT